MAHIFEYGPSSAHKETDVTTNIISTPGDFLDDVFYWKAEMKAEKGISVYSYGESNPDMEGLKSYTDSGLQEALAKAKSEEDSAIKTITAAAEKWEESAYWILLLRGEAMRRRLGPYKAAAPNVWVTSPHMSAKDIKNERIVNSLYEMYVCAYDYGPDRYGKDSIYVTWTLDIICPGRDKQCPTPLPMGWTRYNIAGQRDKRFTSKEEALKYIEGRKTRYARLFMEENPPIPKKYLHNFTIFGALIPGYRVEESDDAKVKGGNKRRKKN